MHSLRQPADPHPSLNWGEAFCALKTDLDPDGRNLQQQVIDQFLSD